MSVSDDRYAVDRPAVVVELDWETNQVLRVIGPFSNMGAAEAAFDRLRKLAWTESLSAHFLETT